MALNHKLDKPHADLKKLSNTATSYNDFVVFMFVVLILQIVILQEQKNNNVNLRMKRWILLGASNFIGLALFLLFLLVIKQELPC